MKKLIHKPTLIAVAIVVIVSATILYANSWKSDADRQNSQLLTQRVQQGIFVASVTGDGTIESEQKITIRNDMTRAATIKTVVPEGTRVSEGDVLIEFESLELANAIKSTKEKVDSDRMLLQEAKEKVELTRQEQSHNVKKAQHAVDEAIKNLERYKKGEAPFKKKELEGKIALAERDLLLAKNKLDFKIKINKDPELKSPYSKNEIKADQLKVQRLELDLDKAKSTLSMFNKYDYPQQILKLENAVVDKKMSLKRAESSRKTQNLLADSKHTTKRRIYNDRVEKLRELNEEDKLRIVRAPADGRVTYNTGGRGWRKSDIVIAEGTKIPSRQQLMVIPNLDKLKVTISVFEARISMVKIGQPVTISAACIPGVIFTGKVKRKADVSTRKHWSTPGVRTYDVDVSFDPHPLLEKLRHTGAASVKIELYRSEKPTLFVPTTAVYRRKRQSFVRKLVNGKPVEVEVKVGHQNDTHVQISSDQIRKGDKIVLINPENLSSIQGSMQKAPGKSAGQKTQRRGDSPSRKAKREAKGKRPPRKGKTKSNRRRGKRQ